MAQLIITFTPLTIITLKIRRIMFQIRIQGRGGKSVVSASELLSVAAFEEGKYAQSFPSFDSERMGTRVQAFARISDADYYHT